MKLRVCASTSAVILSAMLAIPTSCVWSASISAGSPPAGSTPPGGSNRSSGYHHYSHYHHYGRWTHYGYHHRGGYRSSGMASSSLPDTGGSPDESFVRDGHRYYWHYRDGHRFYSSHPEAGDGSGPNMGIGADLDAPLSRKERAARATRMQKAKAHLAAVEQRIARQRHLRRLQELASPPARQRK